MSFWFQFFLLGLAFVGLIVWGLKSGTMPNLGGPPNRETDPVMFWTIGAVHGVGAIMCFVLAAIEGFSKT